MSRIQQKFVDLIKSGEKTIELRKSIFIDKCKSDNPQYENYRFAYDNLIWHSFKIESTYEYLEIYFNGYQIIKKEDFLIWYDILTNFGFQDDWFKNNILFLMIENNIPMWFLQNYKWIWKNIDFIKEYFKNETEILVLFIESWKEI